MLIKGSELNDKQRKEVLHCFGHRNTIELPCSFVGVPPSQTDDQWITAHSFHFTKNGLRLSLRHGHAEPSWMADGQQPK